MAQRGTGDEENAAAGESPIMALGPLDELAARGKRGKGVRYIYA